MNVLPEMAAYMFDLPPERVAQYPPDQRGLSRLMVLGRNSGRTEVSTFDGLPNWLPQGALLIFNNVRVSQARLLGRRADTGGQVEAFILEPPLTTAPAGDYDLWCLVHPGRRLKPGAELVFDHPEFAGEVQAEVLEIHPDGRRLIRFHFNDSPEKVLEAIGHVPLPFYIKRPDAIADRERYQTVYNKTPGAVAAPTAGLHFTGEMLQSLRSQGFELAEVTLKVSAGTFAPLSQEQLETGRLHQEHISVSQAVVESVKAAKTAGRPVVAVGTTTVRSLEWAARSGHLQAQEGFGDLFIRPGYEFRVVDGLVTNFHLPGSSLLMLVAALAGRENVLAAYQKAVAEKFNFYSYGDAMLII